VLTPTATPEPPDTGWVPVGQGIELRSLDVVASSAVERLTAVRLDPEVVRVEVFYTPGQAQLISGWARELGALAVVNAGYFTMEYQATGLIVSRGKVYGTSYGDYAGMFTIPQDGLSTVRWLRTHPYDPREALRGAVQSFPVLVKPGGVMGFPANADDGRMARRTVVAQDRGGRILLLVAPRGYLSLHALAVWLVDSDLEIDVALNMDGGPSSGLWLGRAAEIDSVLPVPAVVAVLGRD
jgi:exopolysaccharide biosynthesis protein